MKSLKVRSFIVTSIFIALELFSENGLLLRLDLKKKPNVELDFKLTEVSSSLNLHFRHETRAPLTKSKAWFTSVGASLAVVDFDNDGWRDIFLTQGKPDQPDRLFRNIKGQFFEDVTSKAGLNSKLYKGVSTRSIFFDCNNDGFKDLFTVGYCPRIYVNKKGFFTEQTANSGLEECFPAIASNVIDINGDGLLDIVYGSYEYRTPDNGLHSDYKGKVRIYENHGQCRFRRWEKSKLKNHPFTIAIGVSDFDGSEKPDIWFAKDYGMDSVYLNDGSDGLIDASKQLGRPYSRHGMSAETVYLQGDVFPRVFVSHVFEPQSKVIEGNSFWTFSKEGIFKNEARKFGIERCGHAWGAKFLDINHDSTQDLLIVNGLISGKDSKDYAYNYLTLLSTSRRVLKDLRNWPELGQGSIWGNERGCLFFNQDGQFIDVAEHTVFGQDLSDGRGIATFDYLNDGGSHFAIINQKGNLKVYNVKKKNNHSWVGFSFQGTCGARDAFGVKVKLWIENQVFTKELQPLNGNASQSDDRLVFGLGSARKVDRVEILWPSGYTMELVYPEPNRYHNLIEDSRCHNG